MRLLLAIILLLLPTTTIAQEEVHCLAEAIYFEARNQSILGQVAVAVVIKNRMDDPRWPNTACGVVHDGHYQNGTPVRHRCAFSYWCDGKSDQPLETEAWTTALNLAEHILITDLTIKGLESATHYHAARITPHWSRTMIRCRQIGEHVFYKTGP